MVNEHEDSSRHHDCHFSATDREKLATVIEDEPILHDVAGAIRTAPIDFVRIILRGVAVAIGLLILAGFFFFLWRGFVYFSHAPAAPPSLPTKQL